MVGERINVSDSIDVIAFKSKISSELNAREGASLHFL